MSDLYSDAFKDDKRDERLFGTDILEETSRHDYDGTADIPESKSNNVSFMKVEELSRDCRNILAVSDSYICYSVTQKKNLLRIIDTQLGDKVILRGHEHFVVDLAFSIADPSLLCSVDNGGGAAENWNDVTGKPHTIVWSKREQGDWRVFAELPLRAQMVKAHPLQAHTWLIAQEGRLGVFSSQRSAAQPVASYEALPLHAVLGKDEVVADAAFSSSGRHVLVAVRSTGSGATSLQVYRVASAGGADSLQRLYSDAPLSVPGLMAVQWTGNHIVTVAALSAAAAGSPTVDYCVSMWLCAAEQELNTSERPRVVQSVTLQLPRSTQGLPSSSLQNPQLECALSLEPNERQRYLLLSSRRSNFVACLAVNPSMQYAAPVLGQPLYHVTCLNLRAPVISVGVTTVLGQAHHSAEAGEHLEVSAYQEAASEPGQASIQQYHVLFGQMFDFAAYSALPQLKALAQAQPAARPHVPPASPTKAPATPAPAASSAAPAPWDEVPAVAPRTANNNKGMTILNMLNNFSRPAASSSPSTPATPAAANASAGAALPLAPLSTPGIVRPTSAGSQSAFTPTTAGGSSSGKVKLEQLLSAKKPAESAAAAPGTDGLPDFLLNTQPASLNSSILNVLKAASGAKPPATPLAVQAPVTPQAVPQSAPVQMKPATPVTPVTAAPAPTIPAKPSAAAPAPAPAVPAPAPSVPKQTNKQPPASVPSVAAQTFAGGEASHEFLAQTVRDLQSSLTAASAAQQQLAQLSLQQHQQQAAKQLQQSVKELQVAQSKHNEGMLAAMKKAVEAEARRALDQNTASAGTMRVEMSEQIMKELVPTISSKVRDSVRDTVRDAVKAQLPAAFRESFESALLPAFEAGAQAMFQQLQGAFAQGMQGVLQEGARVQQSNAAHSSKLEQEVRDLRQTVASLESTVATLAEALQGVLARDQQQQGAVGGQAEAEAPEDAFSMLRQGRISDAVVRVLEDKDIAVTVSLLEQLTPGQVAASCSHLERLCITQQLAADMSVNIPIEGIGKRVDWVKSLVLSLLSNRGGDGTHGDPNYAQHFTSMIGVVLASISAAKKLVYSAQYDTGEDDGLSALQIPQSVGTDLDLLEFVIQSQIAK